MQISYWKFKMEYKKLVLPLALLLLLVPVVSAQATNIFESISGIFGGQDFGTMYSQYWWIIDMIVYLFFFGYVGKLTMGNQFQGKGGGLGIVVGVALSIAVVFFESTSGFRLGNIGPFGLAVALVIFGIVVWRFFKGMGFGGGTSAAWMFVFIYGFALTIASPLFKWIDNQEGWWWDMIVGLLNLFLLIAIIAIAAQLRQFFKGSGSKLGGGLGGILGGGKGGNNNLRNIERAEVGEDTRERGEAAGEAGAAAGEERAEDLVAKLSEQELKDLQAIKNFVDQLRAYAITGRLTPDQVKAIAKAKAGALEAAVKRLLGYSQKAEKANKSAEGTMRNIEKKLKNAWVRKTKIEAAEAKTQAPKGQKNAAYSNMIRPMEQRINQRVQQLMMEARQGERAEENIKQAIEQVKRMEEGIMGEVKALVQDLESGQVQRIPEIVGRMDATITQTEQALASVERLSGLVKAEAEDLRKKFLTQEVNLTREGQAELQLMQQQGAQLGFKM